MSAKMATLADWQTGPTRVFHGQSEIIQWILSADWYNWSYEHRENITRDVEASDLIWLTPTRLGVILKYSCLIEGAKSFARIFIALFDRRIMKIELFRLQTYKEWFKIFFQEIDEEGSDVTVKLNPLVKIAVTPRSDYLEEME